MDKKESSFGLFEVIIIVLIIIIFIASFGTEYNYKLCVQACRDVYSVLHRAPVLTVNFFIFVL